jgi:4-hydroxybenzoate polyprenyltransferase
LTSSSLYLALNSSLVVVLGYVLYDLEISFLVLLAAFLVTFSVYGLNKVTDQAEDTVNNREFAPKRKYFVVSSIAAMILSLGIGSLEGPLFVIVLITPLILGTIYSIRFSKRLPRLKEIVGAKSVSVAFSWAFTGAILPAVVHTVLFEEAVLVFSYIFITLFVNTVLFDVLDLKGDSVSGVRTLPFVLGMNFTKILLLGANSCLIAWMCYCLWRGLFLGFVPALCFGVFYGYLMIFYFLRNKRMRLQAELLVDGEWIPLLAILRLFLR